MEITTDIPLKSVEWINAIEALSNIFKKRTNYDVFVFSLSIGIMYDKRKKLEGSNSDYPSVPRTVIQNDIATLEFMFQAAILSTKTEDFVEKQRLELAFDEKSDFNKMSFLTEFANFGVTKLVELIADTDIETMENIKNFCALCVEGKNFDIDGLLEELILEE